MTTDDTLTLHPGWLPPDLSLRCLTPADRPLQKAMSQAIYTSLPSQEWLIPMTESEYDDTYRTESRDVVYGIFDPQNHLVATSSLLHDVRAYAVNPELTAVLAHPCIEIGESMVLPYYRGHRFMYRLNTLIKREARRQGIRYMLATAHPDNTASCTSLQQLGYKRIKEFTRAGKRRNLFLLDLEADRHAVHNLLFDLAGVLVNLDLEADTRALHAVGLPDFDQCLRRPEICRPALDYLNGIIPEDEFLPLIRSFCTPGVSDDQILWAMDAVLSDFPVSRMAMLSELRSRYNVYLLSNLNERDWQYTLRLIKDAGYDPEQLFHHTFISYQMKMAKPSPLIYQEVMRITGIKPEETLYLDDTASNIEAARRLGFRTELIDMNHLEDLWPIFDLSL